MICPNCGNENEDSAIKCVFCGSDLQIPRTSEDGEVEFCAFCRQPLEPGALFCSYCGRKKLMPKVEKPSANIPEDIADEGDPIPFDGDAPTTFLDENNIDPNEKTIILEENRMKVPPKPGDTGSLASIPPKPEDKSFENKPQTSVSTKKEDGSKNSLVAVIIVVFCIALIVGVIALVKMNSGNDKGGRGDNATTNDSDKPNGDEIMIIPEDPADAESEVTADGVDYDLTKTPTLAFSGFIKPENDAHYLEWKNSLSFYGMDENGQAVRLDDQTRVYIDKASLDPEIFNNLSADETMNVNGNIYILGGVLYISPSTITDESGVDRMVDPVTSEETTEEVTEDVASQFILPQSDTVLLTPDDIADMDYDTLDLAYYEIMARHGFKFSKKKYANHFNGLSWYVPSISRSKFDKETMLSEIEKYNAKLIKSRMKELKQSDSEDEDE